ncbi:MAG: hypothetical protein Q8R24_08040 [Legionellaceae bacterium]|nr:hypothetical protein [Legionellaceae bacterium]
MFFKAEVSTSHISSSLEIVQEFADTHYPDLSLNSKMMEQLLWLQTNSVNTSQSNVQTKKGPVNIEVKRILSRLYCLTLLEMGGTASYALFIQAQRRDNVLSEVNFNRLSAFIQALSPASRQCLMATCFITKSDQAIAAVPVEQRDALPADSEQFITHMVTKHANVFPICHLLNEEERNLLPYAFYKNAHARQMLDMEGGYNMVSSIAEGIRTRHISFEQFNLWFARWIINITGLDGAVNPKGSVYLTEPVADCIFALKLELDQLWLNPQHQVLDQYLLFRAKQLNVSNRYIAYFAALMRQYTPGVGREIQTWFSSLPEHEQLERQAIFVRQLTETKVTPSFKPTVLVTLLDIGRPVADALTIFTQIESNAMQTYTAAVEAKQVSATTPLSFRKIAFEELLSPIVEYYDLHNKLPEFEMNSDGELIVTSSALQNKSQLTFAL